MNAAAALVNRYRHSMVQFVQFGLIGGAGILVNMLTVAICHNIGFHGMGISDTDPVWNLPGTSYNVRAYHVYAIVAFLVANLFNFVWNRHWTFRSGERAPFWKEFGPFLLVGSVAQMVGLVILTLLQNPGSPLFLSHPFFTSTGPAWTKRLYWAQLIQVLCVMPINFVVNKLWTFRAVRRRHAESQAS